VRPCGVQPEPGGGRTHTHLDGPADRLDFVVDIDIDVNDNDNDGLERPVRLRLGLRRRLLRPGPGRVRRAQVPLAYDHEGVLRRRRASARDDETASRVRLRHVRRRHRLHDEGEGALPGVSAQRLLRRRREGVRVPGGCVLPARKVHEGGRGMPAIPGESDVRAPAGAGSVASRYRATSSTTTSAKNATLTQALTSKNALSMRARFGASPRSGQPTSACS
jgi:hypothetical protein